jgi:hypothetical protein
MRKLYFLSLLFMLFGCAGDPITKTQSPRAPGVNLSGYPVAFREGYSDGCASAGGSLQRDEPRYKSDGQYALGWRDGYDICKKR